MDSQRSSARNKLDQILKELVTKAEESQSAAEEEDGLLRGSPSKLDNMPPPTTPSKRSGRAPRKRRKKEVIPDAYTETNRPTYVVKLFDRSVDMAQFRKDTSMYAMCRSWALNKPSTIYELRSSSVSDLEHEDFGLPYSTDDDQEIDEHVNASCAKSAQSMERLDQMMDSVRDFAIVQKDNMTRWRQVRERWRKSSFQTQEKHAASLKHLKSLFTQP